LVALKHTKEENQTTLKSTLLSWMIKSVDIFYLFINSKVYTTSLVLIGSYTEIEMPQ